MKKIKQDEDQNTKNVDDILDDEEKDDTPKLNDNEGKRTINGQNQDDESDDDYNQSRKQSKPNLNKPKIGGVNGALNKN